MMQFFSFTVFLRFLAFSEWKLAAVKALSSGLLETDWYQLNTDVMLDFDLHKISWVSLSMSKETCCKKVRGNAKRSCMFPFKATRRKKVKYIACIIFRESFNLNWLPAYLALYILLTKKFLCPTKTKLPLLFSTLLNKVCFMITLNSYLMLACTSCLISLLICFILNEFIWIDICVFFITHVLKYERWNF